MIILHEARRGIIWWTRLLPRGVVGKQQQGQWACRVLVFLSGGRGKHWRLPLAVTLGRWVIAVGFGLQRVWISWSIGTCWFFFSCGWNLYLGCRKYRIASVYFKHTQITFLWRGGPKLLSGSTEAVERPLICNQAKELLGWIFCG